MPIEVVVQHEAALQLRALRDAFERALVAEVHSLAEPVAREARARVVRLVPRAVVALPRSEEADAAPDLALERTVAGRDEREQGPCRLRRGARSAAAQRVVHV